MLIKKTIGFAGRPFHDPKAHRPQLVERESAAGEQPAVRLRGGRRALRLLAHSAPDPATADQHDTLVRRLVKESSSPPELEYEIYCGSRARLRVSLVQDTNITPKHSVRV